MLARTYKSALEERGYEVHAALSAQSAVGIADDFPPDAVVLELQLPGHNGVEFLYELRSYSDWQDIPVIVHTMVPMGEVALMGSSLRNLLGVQVYLYKPQTTIAGLVKAITEVMHS